MNALYTLTSAKKAALTKLHEPISSQFTHLQHVFPLEVGRPFTHECTCTSAKQAALAQRLCRFTKDCGLLV